jgi:hypothetical protein
LVKNAPNARAVSKTVAVQRQAKNHRFSALLPFTHDSRTGVPQARSRKFESPSSVPYRVNRLAWHNVPRGCSAVEVFDFSILRVLRRTGIGIIV